MEKYNYLEEMVKDIISYIEENEIEVNEDTYDELYDKLWTEDSVTGNASGSYWFNTWKAEEALCHNWYLLEEALTEFCEPALELKKGPEWADVIIRCYVLSAALHEALESLS